MNNDIKEVLFNEDELSDRVRQMGAKISNDYSGKELILIGVLKGSVIFMADLLKEITIPCKMDFMAVSSYGNSTETSGVVRILKDLDFEIQGKDIFVVVSEYETKNVEQGKWEAHRKYIDIQYVVSGEEKIGYGNINEMKIIDEYNEEKDVLFLEGKGDLLLVNKGTFALFAPQDVHMPGIQLNNGQHVKKIVVKILV